MSHIYNIPSTIHHRILELELTDDWLGALLEYGLQHNSQIFSNSLQYYQKTRVGVNNNMIINHTNATKSATTEITREDKKGCILPLEEICDYERRKLRCMIELGHYEAVVDQSSALINRVSELEQV